MFRFSYLGSLIALVFCGTCVACSWQFPDEAHDPTQHQQQHELNAAAPVQRPVTQSSSSCQHVREGDDVYVKILRDGRWTGGWLPARVANVHPSGRLDLSRGHHPKGGRIKPALASGIRRHHLRCDAANHKRKWHERRGERFGSAASSPKRCSKCGDMWRRMAAQIKRSPWYNLVRSAVCASKHASKPNCAATENLRATRCLETSPRCLRGLGDFGHHVAKAARERQLGQGQSCKWKRECSVRDGASKRCPFKKHCEARVQERPFQKGDNVEVKVLDCKHERHCVHKGEWASAWVRAVNGNGASARFDLSDANGRAIEAALPTGIKAHHLRRPAAASTPSVGTATAPSNENPDADAQSASVVREVIEENPPRERGVREHDGKASEWANKDSATSELNRQSVAQLRSEMKRLGLECQAGCVEKSDLVAAIVKHREAHREAQGNVDKETRVGNEKDEVDGEKESEDEVHEANEDKEEDHEESVGESVTEAEDDHHDLSLSEEDEHHDLSLSEEGEGETDHEDAAEEEDKDTEGEASNEERAKHRLKLTAREHRRALSLVESARREHQEAQAKAARIREEAARESQRKREAKKAQLAAAAEAKRVAQAKAKRAAQEQRLKRAQETARAARAELHSDSVKLKTLEAKVKRSEKEAAALAESFKVN